MASTAAESAIPKMPAIPHIISIYHYGATALMRLSRSLFVSASRPALGRAV
jgi:hypothetical protein